MGAPGRILLLAAVSAAIVAGCGSGDGSIPRQDADTLLERLDEVEGAVEEGKCDGARESAALLRQQVGEGESSRVPQDLDAEVRELLERGAERLVQLVSEQCEPAEEPEPEEPFEAPVEPVEPIEPIEPEESDQPPDDDEGDDEGDAGPGGNQGGNPGGGNPGGGSPSGGTGRGRSD